MVQKYKKLVRDRIPEIIRSHGEKPRVRKLGLAEYKSELAKKLVEEALEFVRADDLARRIGEMADIEEILRSLKKVHGISPQVVKTTMQKKLKERGGFDKRIFLEGVEES